MRLDEGRASTDDAELPSAAVDLERERGRALPFDRHVALATTATTAEDGERAAEDRRLGREQHQAQRDDRYVDAERGQRPAPTDRDIDAREDEKQRPQAQERQRGHARNESVIHEQEDQTDRDQDERPEEATASVHRRMRCASSSAPIPMMTSGQIRSQRTMRKTPALPNRKTAPSAMRNRPTAARRRSAASGSAGGEAIGAVAVGSPLAALSSVDVVTPDVFTKG